MISKETLEKFISDAVKHFPEFQHSQAKKGRILYQETEADRSELRIARIKI